MRTYPNFKDKYFDAHELEVLKAHPWQLEMLKKNPSYVYWGNHEDYMSNDNGGWSSRVFLSSWKEHFQLDEYNELVNFYFEIERVSHQCPHCDGYGLNPASKRICDDWYDFNNTGRKWHDKINDAEVKALIMAGRLTDLARPTVAVSNKKLTTTNYHFDDNTNKWMGWVTINGKNRRIQVKEPTEYPTAAEVNQIEKGGALCGHDAINRNICCRTRGINEGVWGPCEYCDGGRIYDAEHATLKLQLWFLHPRKGCSRGVMINEILEDEIPEVIKYLKEAKRRNNQRFGKL
jgi:hypothetical protein